jgi:hypothetical protein
MYTIGVSFCTDIMLLLSLLSPVTPVTHATRPWLGMLDFPRGNEPHDAGKPGFRDWQALVAFQIKKSTWFTRFTYPVTEENDQTKPPACSGCDQRHVSW